MRFFFQSEKWNRESLKSLCRKRIVQIGDREVRLQAMNATTAYKPREEASHVIGKCC